MAREFAHDSELTRHLPLFAILFNTVLPAASGKLILDGKTFELTHVYARQGPSKFDEKIQTTYVLAADRELAADVRVDEETVRHMGWDGKLNSVELEVNGDGISWSIRSSHVKASLSGSQSPDPYKLTIAGGRVRGIVKMEKPGKLGDTEYYFEFPVDAAIEVNAVRSPPAAKDKIAAQTSEAAKAYKIFLAAVIKGDKAGIMKGFDPEKAAQVDSPEFPQMLKIIQSMQPKDIEVRRATESGDTAELDVTGGGGKDTGTVKMQKRNGSWVVMRESWK